MFCPMTCRGVWLDRGELDKMIERAERELTASLTEPPQGYHGGSREVIDDRHSNRGGHRRKSLWKEIFD